MNLAHHLAGKHFTKFGKQSNTKTHTFRMQSVNPTKFCIGDIVEIQLSFVIFLIKGGKFKMALILRSMALLDGTETNVS